eukprot:Anaeramoba_ignava/a484671_18.p1 GENE.a484671_18~~a484671_18.p1  ORF type:complete len:311 (+),score=34.92 a484671_18:494-1426(+)
MNKCLCCSNELINEETYWHKKCIKKFFNTDQLPKIDLNTNALSTYFLTSYNKESLTTGVQKKISLHLQKDGDNARLTMIDYPSGYILKPVSEDYPQLVENEYLTMQLATLYNINTVPFGLIKVEDGTLAYITKRVDRKNKNKIAMVDFCQLGEVLTENKYRSSYEQVGKILAKYSENIGLDYYNLFIIILFSFLVGNSDMHLKNFSLYKKNNKYTLSPAYDLLNTLIVTNDNEELALTIDGIKSNLKKSNFINLAHRYRLNEVQINRVFNSFKKKNEITIKTINESLLNKDLKEKYIEIFEERYKQIFSN